MSEEKDEIEVVEQPDGTFQVAEQGAKQERVEEDHEEEDERTVEASDDGDDEAPEGETEDEAEVRRSKTEENRRKRMEKKQRIRERNETLRKELAARDALIADLTQRVAQQERRSTGAEIAHIDAEIRKAADAYNYFKSSAAALHGQPDTGKQVLDLQEKMILASRRYEDLNRLKQQHVQSQNQPRPIDPVLQKLGGEWISQNSWYDASGGDEDSAIVNAIDSTLAREGWNPGTPEYWEELSERVKKRLPHRYKQSYNSRQGQKPRSVVTGSGRESKSEGGNSGGYTLSRERVQAMRDAGVWDDPKARADAIRRYREFDKQQAA